jgi:hypothetical protein
MKYFLENAYLPQFCCYSIAKCFADVSDEQNNGWASKME